MSACCPHCGLAAPSSQAVGLTAVQRRVMQYIEHCAGENRVPSYDEIAHAIGMNSKSRVHAVIAALVERGHVRHIRNMPRSIVVVGMLPEACA